jgi:FkbM family methyltransferase
VSRDANKRARRLARFARLTRPWMRRKTPLAYRVCQLALRVVCPEGAAEGCELVTSFDGGLIHVDTRSSLEYHLLFRGCHEPAITDLIQRVVKPGSVCLDVGANVGSHTLVLARAAGPHGRVIAVEPHPRLSARLERNVRLNDYRNVVVIAAALADTDGTAPFYGFGAAAFHQGISSLLPDAEASEPMQVATITGRTLAARTGITACDFVKVDVEGAERLVLRELWPLIERHRPYLVFEYRRQHWAKFGSAFDEVAAALHEAGYELLTIRRDVIQPLGARPIPESCEIVGVPRSAAAAA